MQTTTIQQQYDDVIAQHYDGDPHGVTGRSLDKAIQQLQDTGKLNYSLIAPPLRVLDLGMGTGMFLEKLVSSTFGEIDAYGVDLSPGMAEIALQKIPGLKVELDDAANFDNHFGDTDFDLICTHFVTGFVPIEHLAPLIYKRLKPGGIWSFVGSSKAAYPVLRRKANNPVVRMMFGGGTLSLGNLLCPDHESGLGRSMSSVGFEIEATDTFEPELWFADFDSFMQYAYTGGWLTPFIEQLGIHRLNKAAKALLNGFVFPVRDHHSILLGLARKPKDRKSF